MAGPMGREKVRRPTPEGAAPGLGQGVKPSAERGQQPKAPVNPH